MCKLEGIVLYLPPVLNPKSYDGKEKKRVCVLLVDCLRRLREKKCVSSEDIVGLFVCRVIFII